MEAHLGVGGCGSPYGCGVGECMSPRVGVGECENLVGVGGCVSLCVSVGGCGNLLLVWVGVGIFSWCGVCV